MRRDDVLLALARAAERRGAAIFVGNGNNARSMATLDDRPTNFYMVGSMGECPCVAAGFSSRARRPVIAVEGDGNALMGMSGWASARAAVTESFVHVVLDNGVYETTGGQLTLAPRVDLPRIARGVGYEHVVTPRSIDELAAAVEDALAGRKVCFLYVETARDDLPQHGRVPYHPREIRSRFSSSWGNGAAEEPLP